MTKLVLFFGFCFLLSSNAAVTRTVAQGGPIDVSGDINGAPFRIVVPANWNGTLLVWAHGIRDKADHPGEIDDRSAEIGPNPAVENALLDEGYALAGSAYRDNGWAVEEGVQDVKDLTVYFRDRIARPNRTIVWAESMGTIITFKSIEQFTGIYDGALCSCAVGGGATRLHDTMGGDLSLAYDMVFGMPPSWGTFGDIRDDIDFSTEVRPKLIAEVSDPLNFPKFEFVRLVTGIPGRGIIPPPGYYPGWVFGDMMLSTELRSELERRAGGAIVQNLNRNYTLTAPERAYLMSLGVPSSSINNWLNVMNAQRNVSAPPFSRNYVEHNSDYSGKIKQPILTMHTIFDPVQVVSQHYEYAETVRNAGRDDLLFQTYTNGVGHCTFTQQQWTTAINAIDSWVATGTKPTAATFSTTPGFLPNFVPPPMNQP